MGFWTIVSWIATLGLTGLNIFIFLKLKKASEEMMKMAFPGAKNMQDAMGQMQNMLQGMKGRANINPHMHPGLRRGQNPAADPRLQKAIEMLEKMGKN